VPLAAPNTIAATTMTISFLKHSLNDFYSLLFFHRDSIKNYENHENPKETK
jgi:hypothetical protein